MRDRFFMVAIACIALGLSLLMNACPPMEREATTDAIPQGVIMDDGGIAYDFYR